MEGPYIKITVPNVDSFEKDKSEDNDFSAFMGELERINPRLWEILRSLTADSSNKKGRPRYVINEGLQSKGSSWKELLRIAAESDDYTEEENELRRELFSIILPHWDDRSEQQNIEMVSKFMKEFLW